MKHVLLKIITLYQTLISPTLKQLLGIKASCRFSPTCSEYARQSIEKHGTFRGGILVMKRILSCQPFSKNYKYV